MNTDLTVLYKTITESVPNYLMFILLMLFAYLLIVASIKILCENIIKVILAARSPVSFKVNQEKN